MKKKVLMVVLIIIAVILGYFLGVRVEKNKNSTDKTDTKEKYTYLTWTAFGSTDEVESAREIFTFDSNNVCIDNRVVYNFSTEEIAQREYKRWQEVYDDSSNLKINSTEVSFSTDVQNGRTKQEIKEDFHAGNLKEIVEY